MNWLLFYLNVLYLMYFSIFYPILLFFRSKRLKLMKDSISNSSVNEVKLFRPIPFNEGIPDKIIKNRAEFRLPCHISLLKHNSVSLNIIYLFAISKSLMEIDHIF